MATYNTILAASDLSEQALLACERAAEMAKFHGARLMLLHVVDHFPVDQSNKAIGREDVDPKHYRLEQAEAALAEFVKNAGMDDAGYEIVVSSEAAKYEIIKYAETHEVDLVVLASHGHHGFTSLLGSTSDRVIHQAPCDVLVVKEGSNSG